MRLPKPAPAFLMFVAVLSTVQPAVAETNLSQPCALNFALLGGEKSAELLSKIVFDKIPSAAQAAAQTPRVATSSVVYQIPLSEADYKAVFKTASISTTERSEIEAAGRLLTATTRDVASVNSEDTFAKFLKNTTSKNVIVVGHNEDGSFAFLDGSRTRLWNLSQLCAEAAKSCVFISCRSNDYVAAGSQGVRRDLTLAEGIYIADKIHGWLLTRTGQITDIDLAKFSSEVETQAFLKYHVAYIALNGCGAVGGATVVYVYVEGIQQ
jgi:hypothetical protein